MRGFMTDNIAFQSADDALTSQYCGLRPTCREIPAKKFQVEEITLVTENDIVYITKSTEQNS
jgi:hypothetical protein